MQIFRRCDSQVAPAQLRIVRNDQFAAGFTPDDESGSHEHRFH